MSILSQLDKVTATQAEAKSKQSRNANPSPTVGSKDYGKTEGRGESGARRQEK